MTGTAARMRVAVDATPLHGARTGVGRFTHEILCALASRPDLEVIAYSLSWRAEHPLAELVPTGVSVVRRPMAATPLLAAWRRLDRPRIERWTGRVDLVHGTNFVVPPADAARVVTVHDVAMLRDPAAVNAAARRFVPLITRAVKKGAWVHTVSDFVREEVIERFGADPRRVVAVPNGITSAPSADPERGRRLAGGTRYILALGTVEPRKDLPTLVGAFDRLAAGHPDLRLVVAGPDGWGVTAYEEAVRSAEHSARIVRLGTVDEDERGDLLAGATLLALTSSYEGFGLTAGEAMLAGAPVVATAAGAVPEVVGDAGLLVPVGDRDALTEAMDRVLTRSALAADLRRRGEQRAARFRWETTASGLVALWTEAMGERAGRR
jgi:glycosyltransferase involved in cell wall biosynthesis